MYFHKWLHKYMHKYTSFVTLTWSSLEHMMKGGHASYYCAIFCSITGSKVSSKAGVLCHTAKKFSTKPIKKIV